MRHRIAGKKLNRDSQHRQSLFKNLVSDLIRHGSIVTTPAKAKAVQGMVDGLMTKAKKGGVYSRRLIHTSLNRTELVNKLVDVIAPITKNRVSGFTRVTKLSPRMGDNAAQVRLEWVDKAEAPKIEKSSTAKTTPKKSPVKKAEAPKTAPAATLKPPSKEPKKPVTTAPKAGMIRQKSGER
jgi:large subunit ribosomal protein L17